MSIIDEHNRQHTYGSSLGPPTSVVGVSAQQSIDAHHRPVSDAGRASSHARAGLSPRNYYVATLASGGLFVATTVAAYMIGGIGAVALGLVAVIAGMFGVVFLIAGVIQSAKSGVASRRGTPGTTE